jgi:hypothetical protein
MIKISRYSIITTLIKGGDDILYHYKLTYICLPDLGRVLYYYELTYSILPFISILWPIDEEQ